MDAHHGHAHAAEEPKPEVTGTIGTGMGLGMLGMLAALIGVLRPSEGLLQVGGVAGLAGVVLAVAGIGFGATSGKGTRGWLVAVATGVMAALLWLLAGPNLPLPAPPA